MIIDSDISYVVFNTYIFLRFIFQSVKIGRQIYSISVSSFEVKKSF